MASRRQDESELPPPSEVSVTTGRGVRLPDFNAAGFVDFAAEACDRIVAERSRTSGPSRVDVLIATNAEMRRLNREFRHKDTPTDVISFPAASNGHALQGDIAISADITAENARRLRHSVDDELKILILHGMLHLAGYDHECDKGEMAKFERQLRRELDLPVSLIERGSPRAGPLVRRSRADSRTKAKRRGAHAKRTRSAR